MHQKGTYYHHDIKMKDEAGNSRVLDEIVEEKDLVYE
jgi:hypothetical protein